MTLRIEAKIESDKVKTPTQIIDQICELAKADKKDELSKLISSGICIDIYDGTETASQRIASEEEVDINALELLITLGATLNNAVAGAARGGHFSLVENLLSRGAALNYAVEGAAYRGYIPHVNKLIDLGASLNWAVRGAAHGGHVNLVNDLFRAGAMVNYAVEGAAHGKHHALFEKYINDKTCIVEAVAGAVLGGNSNLIKKLLHSNDSKRSAVVCAARMGNLEFVNELIRSGASLNIAVGGAAHGGQHTLVENLLHRGAALDYAVRGAGKGGHLAMVENLLSRGALLTLAISGAGRGGQCALIEALLPRGVKTDQDHAVEGAGYGGHIAQVKRLIGSGASLKSAATGAATGLHLANKALILRWLFFMQNTDLQLFAKEIRKSANTSFNVKTLVAEARTLSSLSQDKQISFEQATAWQDPHVQGLFIMAQLQKYLPRTLYFTVMTFLTPSLSDSKDAEDLYQKMRFDIRKSDLTHDLQRLYKSSSMIPFFRDKKPDELKSICEGANSEQELNKIIEDHMGKMTEKDNCLIILQNHALDYTSSSTKINVSRG